MAEKLIRVLIVDDHTMFRQALIGLVSRSSLIRVVGETGDAMKVVELAKELEPDVTILDISMPGWNGLDICRELTRSVKTTSVLMLTMHDREEFVVNALRNGAAGYLLKTAATDQLIEAIQVVASGGLYLGPGISRSVLQRVGKDVDDLYEQLTVRQRQILQLIAEGKTNRQIADVLHLAVKTVDVHRTRLMRKLNIHDQTTLVKYALRKGVVPL